VKNLSEVLDKVGSTAAFVFTSVVDVNQRNYVGDTPLHVVCRWGDAGAVKILLESGADVNALGEARMSPLFAAVMGGSVDVVNMLLNAGGDLTIKCEDGIDVLQFASLLDKTKKLSDDRLVGILASRSPAQALNTPQHP
jgi:uncharacterized protein